MAGRWIAALAGIAGSAAQVQAAPAQGVDPAPAPVAIELYTMGPGEPLLERFGHAALCVRWSAPAAEHRCYNYGTADFSAPAAMTWSFIRGDAEFWVETWPHQAMLDHYVAKDRTVWVQRLTTDVLPAETLGQIARKLDHDTRVENRYYTYHHFRDNCTTRVRDILDQATGGALRSPASSRDDPRTFRELGYVGFADHDLLRGLFDLAIGRSTDRRPTAWEAMFLPRELRAAVTERLGVEPEVVYRRQGPPLPEHSGSPYGLLLLLAALVAAPALVTTAMRRRRRLGLTISVTILGLMGLGLWLLALVSPMAELRGNETLLVLVPTDLAFGLLSDDARRRYGRVRLAGVGLIGLMRAVGVLRQPLYIGLALVAAVFTCCLLPPDRRASSDSEAPPPARP